MGCAGHGRINKPATLGNGRYNTIILLTSVILLRPLRNMAGFTLHNMAGFTCICVPQIFAKPCQQCSEIAGDTHL